MEPIVVTEKLRKAFANRSYCQLGLIDLTVHPGEIVGVLGPRWSGKSLLLRLLWGFTRPDHGSVRVFGMQPHVEQIKVRRHAGYMSQVPPIYTAMTAGIFVHFIGQFYGDTWDAKRVNDGLERFQIPMDQYLAYFSKGQRVKLSLLAATGHHPKLLILDEPLTGVEPHESVEIRRFIRHQAKKENVAVVLSASSKDDLSGNVDSVLALKEGRVAEYASIMGGHS